MPWKKEATVLKLRKEFVTLATRKQANMSQLCRRFGISRKTGYKWLRRWEESGEDGLKDRSRKPKTSPDQTPEHIEEHVLKTHHTYSEWGSRKLRKRMLRLVRRGDMDLSEDQVPAASTILKILKRHDRWTPHVYGPGQDVAKTRFEYEEPNQLWQLDFKGEFFLLDQSYCYPMTLIDDHSRFSLSLQAFGNTQHETVKSSLIAVFRRYGLCDALLVDNGPPWGSGLRDRNGRPYYTKLSVWLMRLGVRVIHSRPGHPQTHGKNERFNGTLKAELLSHEQFRNLGHAQQRFDWWRHRYNFERPHQGIDDQVPMDRYQPSRRNYPETLPPVEYDQTDQVRKVSGDGTISYQNHEYKIGKGFVGQHIAIRKQKDTPKKMVYFCHQPIKEISPKTVN